VNTVNTSSGTNLSYIWDFGDTFTTNLETPSRTYSASGTFTIILIVTDDCAQTDTFTQNVSITVGIATINSDFSVSVYPNPNDGEFILSYELSKPGNVNVLLMNMLGVKVHETNAFEIAGQHVHKINLTRIPKGVYILQLRNDDLVVVKNIAVK